MESDGSGIPACTAQLFKVKADVANRLRLLERPLGKSALN